MAAASSLKPKEKPFMNTIKNRSLSQMTESSQSSIPDEIDIFKVLQVIWRGRLWIVLCMLVCFIAGGYYAYRIAQPSYSATAVIEFAPKSSQLLGLEAVVSGTSVDQASLNTEIATILSREMGEAVVKKMGLGNDARFNSPRPLTLKDRIKRVLGMLAPPQVLTIEQKESLALRRATSWVQNSITANGSRDTYLLKITARADKPGRARQLANATAESYIQSQLDEKYVETEQAIDWLSGRVKELETDLRDREIQINNLLSNADMVNTDVLQALQLQIKEFRDRLASRQKTRATIQEQVTIYQNALASESKIEILAAFDDRLLDRIGTQLEDNLEGSTGDRDAFFARAEALVDASRLSLARVQEEIAGLSQSVTSLEIKGEEQSRDLRILRQMQRELSVSQNLYNTFLVGLQETTVQVGLVRPDSRIMSRADMPQSADTPRKGRILAMSLFSGFLIGLAFILIREALNNRIQDMNELESLTNLPVLGSVPIFPIRKREELLRFIASNPMSSEMEAIRNLRTSILMQNSDKPSQIIMISSSIPGEGKTSLSLSLSHNLSGLGKRVLLVEGDIRRRTINKYLDKSQVIHGILDVVSGEASLEDAIIHVPNIGVDILAGQHSEVNPADIFSSTAFQDLLDRLKKSYDHIVIDTPPVLVVPDARIIASMADKLLYIVKWDSTSREQIKSGVKLFEDFGQTISGFAITQVNVQKIRKYGYSDQYGAYANYGKSYYSR
tara:strand:+ start:195 stop:2387 length:2193 start_codon:yes stop_codon:yes gene_type:complete